jgi:YgiT-type zinc finger domain-containing protein
MKCPYCKGKLVKKNVSYTATRQGYHLIIDDVPAWVCEQCGEPLFEDATVDTIQAMLREVERGIQQLAAPIPAPT